MVMHLACVTLHMTMPEALAAATINAAASLGVASQRGSIELGKAGDLVIVNADRWVWLYCLWVWSFDLILFRWEHLVYQFGCHGNTIKYVVKEGKVVVENKTVTH